MNATVHFTDANFEREVLDSDRPVLVDFWASWCGPCRAVGPTIDALAEEIGGALKVGKLNIDDHPQSPAKFDIQSIPAVLLFRGGKVVESLVGVQPKQRYREAVERVSARHSAAEA
jgi:thioredoxin 1